MRARDNVMPALISVPAGHQPPIFNKRPKHTIKCESKFIPVHMNKTSCFRFAGFLLLTEVTGEATFSEGSLNAVIGDCIVSSASNEVSSV